MATTAKLSLAEYEKIVATGVFDGPNQRHIELIQGELREMNPIGPDHCEVVDLLACWSIDNLRRDQFRVRVQNPIALADVESEPQPDLAWARQQPY
ncbi:MAG TPA: Uma2 family endonuclease [Pirellulales bacterium]|jgi:Uma2 family endonuclease|nr:Uma2 family endonuclease [Pirellulales bacterium]